MGTWGYEILENDTAVDVYGVYMDLYNADTPTDKIRSLAEGRCPSGTNFWLGLAQAQWECKALDLDVLENVEKIVQEDAEKGLWDEPDYSKRKAALNRFLATIRKPRAKPKRRVPPKSFSAPFTKGDCVVFRHAHDRFGGVLCLGATDKPERAGKNVIALLRICQNSKPTVEDFAASHILVKGWGEVDGKAAKWADSPEPEISTLSVVSIEDDRQARSHEVIGRLNVEKTFGEQIYGMSCRWQWDDVLEHQLTWESEHPELEIDFSFPVSDFIRLPSDPDWAALGESFAASQRGIDDFADFQRRCRTFRGQVKKLGFSEGASLYRWIAEKLGLPQGTDLCSWLAQYSGSSRDRAQNRVEDILRNAK